MALRATSRSQLRVLGLEDDAHAAGAEHLQDAVAARAGRSRRPAAPGPGNRSAPAPCRPLAGGVFVGIVTGRRRRQRLRLLLRRHVEHALTAGALDLLADRRRDQQPLAAGTGKGVRPEGGPVERGVDSISYRLRAQAGGRLLRPACHPAPDGSQLVFRSGWGTTATRRASRREAAIPSLALSVSVASRSLRRSTPIPFAAEADRSGCWRCCAMNQGKQREGHRKILRDPVVRAVISLLCQKSAARETLFRRCQTTFSPPVSSSIKKLQTSPDSS